MHLKVLRQNHRTLSCHGPPLPVAVEGRREPFKQRMFRIHQLTHAAFLLSECPDRPEVGGELSLYGLRKRFLCGRRRQIDFSAPGKHADSLGIQHFRLIDIRGLSALRLRIQP